MRTTSLPRTIVCCATDTCLQQSVVVYSLKRIRVGPLQLQGVPRRHTSFTYIKRFPECLLPLHIAFFICLPVLNISCLHNLFMENQSLGEGRISLSEEFSQLALPRCTKLPAALLHSTANQPNIFRSLPLLSALHSSAWSFSSTALNLNHTQASLWPACPLPCTPCILYKHYSVPFLFIRVFGENCGYPFSIQTIGPSSQSLEISENPLSIL